MKTHTEPTERTLAEKANYVINEFGRLGISLPPDHRLNQARSVLLDDDGKPTLVSSLSPAIRVAQQAQCDFQQLGFVFDQLEFEPRTVPFGRLLAVGNDTDAVLPADDRYESSHSRNAQVELYVAAILSKAGHPAEFREPDLRVAIDGNAFGIAIKRIKSRRQLERKLCQGAARQVDRHSERGVIIVDVCIPFDADMPSMNAGQAFEYRKTLFQKYLSETDSGNRKRGDRICEALKPLGVRGVVFQEHYPRRDPWHGFVVDSLSFYLVVCSSRRRRLQWGRFRQVYVAGLPTDEYGAAR